MKIAKAMTCFAGGLLALLLTVPPQAKADVWNQKTVFTFSGPVEIPGQVLPPGTYVFKLLDSQANRNVVQVFDETETRLYGTFLTIADYRMKPADKSIITFTERAADAPEAVQAWFYPGENYGHDFVYPKGKAVELAKTNNEPVASVPNELAENTAQPTTDVTEPPVVAMEEAPLVVQQSNSEPADVSEVFAAPEADRTGEIPSTLPQTASPLPLVGLIGLLSLGVSGSLGVALAKMN